jgi:hypothetical protein
MGNGQFSVQDAVYRSTTNNYAEKSLHQVFTVQSLSRDSKMNPRNISIRESRDSAEHPNSLAVIVGLDVTGSMGSIPHYLLATGLPHIMEKIFQSGEKDPQILLTAIGDHLADRAPLQVGQFESSDELLDKWLKETYVEGNGGGNGGESYHLAWYFAGKHTSIDCFEKRGRKGLLFTIGDEPVHNSLSEDSIRGIMGDGTFKSYSAAQLLEEAMKKYDVYHIHCAFTSSGSQDYVKSGWTELMGKNVLMATSKEEVARLIADTVVKHKQYSGATHPSKDARPVPSEEIL